MPVYNRACVGDVAQLGEHQVRNLGVKGSNPSVSTNHRENSRREFKASAFCVAKKFADISADDFLSYLTSVYLFSECEIVADLKAFF